MGQQGMGYVEREELVGVGWLAEARRNCSENFEDRFNLDAALALPKTAETIFWVITVVAEPPSAAFGLTVTDTDESRHSPVCRRPDVVRGSGRFRTFSDVFGRIRTFSDVFGWAWVSRG